MASGGGGPEVQVLAAFKRAVTLATDLGFGVEGLGVTTDGVAATLADVEELGGDGVGMASRDNRKLAMNKRSFSRVELPKGSVTFILAVRRPDGGVTELVNQGVPQSLSAVDNLLRQFDRADVRDDPICGASLVLAKPGRLEESFAPDDGEVGGELQVEDGLVEVLEQSRGQLGA